MVSEVKFPEIDTSFWKTNEREWVIKRKAQWEIIEPMLAGSKLGKGKKLIKQYFLKGKMPDWNKLRDWNSYERHVDLFMFIWLHPSWDELVLKPLRDAYMTSDQIVRDDLKQGFGNLWRWGIILACEDYTGQEEEWPHCLHTNGHNEILFKILMGDLNTTQYNLEFVDCGLGRKKAVFNLPKAGLFITHTMGRWLCIKTMLPINSDMLFQYDTPLEWWYQSCETDEDYFKQRKNRGFRELIEKALWRIHNFDTVKEGPSPRTTFVTKIRKILDERPFIAEIETMWGRVKIGEIIPEDPWSL